MNNSVPVSSGIGTGKAQVYSFDKTSRALENALGYAMQEKEYQRKLNAAKEAEQQRKKEKTNDDIIANTKVNYQNVRMADRDAIRGIAKEIQKKYRGKWKDIAEGGDVLVEYLDDVADLEIIVANSIETAKTDKEYQQLMKQYPERFTRGQKDAYFKDINTPLRVVGKDGYLEGVFMLPKVINVPLEISKNFSNIFYKDKKRTETDAGVSAIEGEIFVDDTESLEALKKQLALDPELLVQARVSLGLEYNDELTDEHYKQIHDAAKALLPEYKKIIQTSKKDDSAKGSLSEQGITLNKNKKTTDGKSITTLTAPNLKVTGTVEYEKDGETKRQVVDEANINDIYIDSNGGIYGYVIMQDDKENNVLREVKLFDSAALNSINSQVKKITKGKEIIDVFKEGEVTFKTEPTKSAKSTTTETIEYKKLEDRVNKIKKNKKLTAEQEKALQWVLDNPTEKDKIEKVLSVIK